MLIAAATNQSIAPNARQDHLAGYLQAAIAEEIRHVRTLLEQLADVLVADERFALNFIEQLQTFDLIIQHVDESANLLDRMAEGSTSDDALKSVRLEALKDRLRNALDKAA